MFGLFKKKSEHITTKLEKNQIIHLFDQTQFKTGSSLEVKPNTFAVVAKEGKVLDIFPDGMYSLVLDRIPKLFKYLKENSARDIDATIKKFSMDLYFLNGGEVELNELLSRKLKLIVNGKKLGLKINFSIKFKIELADIFMLNILKHRKIIQDKQALKVFENIINKELNKTTKNMTLDINEPDLGLLNLSKIVLVKFNLSKFGVKVVALKMNKIKSTAKTLDKLNSLNNANKTLDVEFKRFTNAETDEVVLEKVGTEAFLDKALPVDVIAGGGKSEDVALLNINTGEDAQKEVVFVRNEEPQLTEISNNYFNKMDGILLKPSEKQQNENINQSTLGKIQSNFNFIGEQGDNKRDLFCRQCGARAGINDKFCGNCGNRLN